MNQLNQRTNAATGRRPWRTWRRLGSAAPRSVLTALALLAGGLASVVATGLVRAPAARADTVPPPPSGWTTVFGDNFAGAAGSAPSSANWFYDIGTGYGTGEKEQTTNSTNNVYLDGSGHLVLKAINNGGTWTSGRIESTRDDFQAPAGGKLEMTASIEQPNPASGLGYWPAFWALGSPMRTGGGWPQSGEIDMMEDVNGLNEASQTFHNSANSPGHPLIACPGAGSGCQTGYHTYTVIIDRTNTSAETMQFLMDGVVESTITEASVGTAAWQAAVDHGFFIIFDLAMGGNYPDGISGTTTPTSATTSGASMSVGYVAVYEQGGNSTPAGTATATGTVTGINGLCLANQNSLNTSGNPIGVTGCNGSAGQAVVAVLGRDTAHPGRLPGRGQRGHHERHQRGLVPVQRDGRPGLDAPVQRRAGQPGLRAVPHRSRRQYRRPAGHRDLHRLRPAEMDPAHRAAVAGVAAVAAPAGRPTWP